jgi:hypothetical protein
MPLAQDMTARCRALAGRRARRAAHDILQTTWFEGGIIAGLHGSSFRGAEIPFAPRQPTKPINLADLEELLSGLSPPAARDALE